MNHTKNRSNANQDKMLKTNNVSTFKYLNSMKKLLYFYKSFNFY